MALAWRARHSESQWGHGKLRVLGPLAIQRAAGVLVKGRERERENRGAVTRRGLCLCLVFGEGRLGSHSVVLCHILDYPKADHCIKTWCGWAGQEPEGHDVTPKPSRKKERDR